MAKIAAYYDPDRYVVYLIEFKRPLGWAVRLQRAYHRIGDPMMFHLTVNVPKAEAGLRAFESLGFKTLNDQREDQVRA
eukprot:2191565-Pleurochrysis_carterae.AAC.1